MNPPEDKISLIAYHGTTSQNANTIIQSKFIIHSTPEDWLGHGVYFFVEGVACPIKSAGEWAKNTHHNEQISIVRSKISAPQNLVLNLTYTDQLQKYNDTRDEIINEHYENLKTRRDLTIKKRRDIRLDDQTITNLILQKLGIKILVHNTYIKNALQRELALESSYPNSTVCCVTDLSLIAYTEIHSSHAGYQRPKPELTF